MTSLESRLAEELHHEADQVHDLPDLAERVVARGHAVRRRRALSVGAMGVVAVLIAVGAVLGGNDRTASAPPANRTPEPSPSTTLSDGLRQLPLGSPPDGDYVVGTTAHLGGRTVRLPADWVVTDLLRAGDRWIMIAQASDARVVGVVTAEGDVGVIDRTDALGLAIDPTGRYVAWGSERQSVSSQENLTVYDLTTNLVMARHRVNQPVKVQGWAAEGVIASYRRAPGGTPVVWDPQSDTITNVWGGDGEGPAFAAYTPIGHRWVLVDNVSGCGVLISGVGDSAPTDGCARSMDAPAAFFNQGRSLAVTDGGGLRIVDQTLADTGTEYSFPAGLVALQVVPVGGPRLLVLIADSTNGTRHVLRCVGDGQCERALDADPEQQIALAIR